MKQPTMICPGCGGTGEMPIPPHLADTLAALKTRRHGTALDLSLSFPGITVNAISNRLAELLQLDFVSRQRRGKFWVYSAAKTGAAK